jgi:hypothetical protein
LIQRVFGGKILQKWAYLFGGNKKLYGSPYLDRILKQKLLHILTSSQIWLIPLVDDCLLTYLTKLQTKLGSLIWFILGFCISPHMLYLP